MIILKKRHTPKKNEYIKNKKYNIEDKILLTFVPLSSSDSCHLLGNGKISLPPFS